MLLQIINPTHRESDKEIFSTIKFSPTILEKRIRELAFLNKGICIRLLDKTSKKEKEFVHKYDGGIMEFVRYLNQKKPILVNKNEKENFTVIQHRQLPKK